MQNKIMGSKRCVWLGLIKLNSYFPLHQELCPFQVGRSAVVQKWRWCAVMYFNCSVCLFVHHCISFSLRLSHSLPASLSVYQSQFACLTIGLSHSFSACLTRRSVSQFACLTIRVYQSVCLPDYPSISQFACLTQRSVSQLACLTDWVY